jgi:uncharacterized protein GlcG (DUF336 family)
MLISKKVSLADAQRLIALGLAKAADMKSPSNIAVVDAGGHLVAHVRMDGAQIASIEHAIDKAFTSVAFQSPTGALAKDSQPGGQFFGMANTVNGRAIVFAGGVPLMSGDELVGAVGVSGGSGEQDQQIAEAIAASL